MGPFHWPGLGNTEYSKWSPRQVWQTNLSSCILACLTCEFVLIAGLFMCSCTYKKKSTNNEIVQSCQKKLWVIFKKLKSSKAHSVEPNCIRVRWHWWGTRRLQTRVTDRRTGEMQLTWWPLKRCSKGLCHCVVACQQEAVNSRGAEQLKSPPTTRSLHNSSRRLQSGQSKCRIAGDVHAENLLGEHELGLQWAV